MEKTNQNAAQETKTEQVQETKPQIRKPKITGAGVKNFMVQSRPACSCGCWTDGTGFCHRRW